MITQPNYNHDAHVRQYYDMNIRHFPEHPLNSSKFGGERLAVALAYERNNNGFGHDDFGSVDEGGYYARVCFAECPFIVCYKEDNQGFVTEVDCDDYEAIWAQYIEDNEDTEENNEEAPADLTEELAKLKAYKEQIFAISMELESLAEAVGYPQKSDLLEVTAVIQEQCDKIEELLK